MLIKSAAVLILGALVHGAPAAPTPESLLDSALNPPDIYYQGRMMVTHWVGKQTNAEEVEVYHAPDNKTRREFLAPDGRVMRIVVSDGDNEQVQWVKSRKVLKGDAVKSYEKLMSPEKERDLLLKNYRLSATGQEKVAGRGAWILELSPLIAGKPHQRLWIDQETGVVLENKRFLPKNSFASMARFNRFEPREPLDAGLFRLELDSAVAVTGKGLEPDFMSIEDLNAATGKESRFPETLPEGFVFESADFFNVGKLTIRHVRYTDGLAVLSLFQTDRPVRLPKKGSALSADSAGSGSLRLSSAGHVLPWKRGKQYFTLMGDTSHELLRTISAGLR